MILGDQRKFLVRRLTCGPIHFGPTFWGRLRTLEGIPTPSHIRVDPVSGNAWLYKRGDTGVVSKVDLGMAHVKNGKLVLKDVRDRRLVMHHYAQYGAFRYLGLMGIQFLLNPIINAWPPYSGKLKEWWQCLEQAMIIDPDTDFILYTPISKFNDFVSGSNFVGRTPSTTIHPSVDGRMVINVIIDMPGLPRHEEVFSFPDDMLLLSLTECMAVGKRKYYWLAKLVSMLRLWPHFENTVWPQEHDPAKLVKMMAFQRVLEILSACSLVCGDGMFVARITSYNGSSTSDLSALLQCYSYIQKYTGLDSGEEGLPTEIPLPKGS